MSCGIRGLNVTILKMTLWTEIVFLTERTNKKNPILDFIPLISFQLGTSVIPVTV